MNVSKNSTLSESQNNRIYTLALLALGVVYGDIGTSPLYALRECLSPRHHIAVIHDNIFGVLSLIFWSLIVVICIKYISFVMRADNEGEGGILALLTLVVPRRNIRGAQISLLLVIGLFGAALFFGDGMLTPAISVLSAIEGLKIATPIFNPYVIPITIVILVALFLFQKRGTGVVGRVFGPVMLLWYSTLAFIGVLWIIKVPEVLGAINPLYAVEFFVKNGYMGFVVLGAVFLTVTGGEALYADLGHFGKQPIRLGWFMVVLPGLLLNYFGQGALLISKPEAIRNPFYLLVPSWGLYPLIALATAATIIASQAVISGAFSLTRQAVQLGYLPRLEILHTSPEEIGQVYTPLMNSILLVGTVGLVLGFRSSENLAGAYGVAISAMMVIDSILLFVYLRTHRDWSILSAAFIVTFFLTFDLSFFGSNMLKLKEGAWFPLLVGAIIYLLMTTWNRGRAILKEQILKLQIPVGDFLNGLAKDDTLTRVPGTAVFMVSSPDNVPQALLHNLKHNKVIHERVILLTMVTEEVPRVPRSKKLEIEEIAPGFFRIIAHLGFMENANVPTIMRLAAQYGQDYNPMDTTFFLGRETLVLGNSRRMSRWRKKLFALLSRNAQTAPAHFDIPPTRSIEIGTQVEI